MAQWLQGSQLNGIVLISLPVWFCKWNEYCNIWLETVISSCYTKEPDHGKAGWLFPVGVMWCGQVLRERNFNFRSKILVTSEPLADARRQSHSKVCVYIYTPNQIESPIRCEPMFSYANREARPYRGAHCTLFIHTKVVEPYIECHGLMKYVIPWNETDWPFTYLPVYCFLSLFFSFTFPQFTFSSCPGWRLLILLCYYLFAVLFPVGSALYDAIYALLTDSAAVLVTPQNHVQTLLSSGSLLERMQCPT